MPTIRSHLDRSVRNSTAIGSVRDATWTSGRRRPNGGATSLRPPGTNTADTEDLDQPFGWDLRRS